MKRGIARRDYLKLSKCKKRSAKKLLKGVRKQLQYIRRDVGFIVDIIRKTQIKVKEKVPYPKVPKAEEYCMYFPFSEPSAGE